MENLPNYKEDESQNPSIEYLLKTHSEECIEISDLAKLGELTPLSNSSEREGYYLGDYVIKTSGKSTTAERTIKNQAKNLAENPNLPIVVSKQYIKTDDGKEYLIEPYGELFKDFYIKNPADMDNNEFEKMLNDFMGKWANEFPNDFDDFSLEKHLLVYKEVDRFVLKLTDADLSKKINIDDNQKNEIVKNLLESMNEAASEFKKKVKKVRSIGHEIANTVNEVRILNEIKGDASNERVNDVERIKKDFANITEGVDNFCSGIDEILEDNDLKRTNEKFLSYKDNLRSSYREISDNVHSIDTYNFPNDKFISRIIISVDILCKNF